MEHIILKLIAREHKKRWRKAQMAAWQLNNRVKIAARRAARYQANREKIIAQVAAYNKDHHKENCIRRWIARGIKLRPDETWDSVYDKYMATTQCESCEIVLDDNCWSTHRNLDHLHKGTYYIRGTICFLCNHTDQWQKRMTSTSVYNSYKL